MPGGSLSAETNAPLRGVVKAGGVGINTLRKKALDKGKKQTIYSQKNVFIWKIIERLWQPLYEKFANLKSRYFIQ